MFFLSIPHLFLPSACPFYPDLSAIHLDLSISNVDGVHSSDTPYIWHELAHHINKAVAIYTSDIMLPLQLFVGVENARIVV